MCGLMDFCLLWFFLCFVVPLNFEHTQELRDFFLYAASKLFQVSMETVECD